MRPSFLRRATEAFFRRWPFYAALFALCVGLGSINLVRTANTYTSYGSLFVQARPLAAAQTGEQPESYLRRLTPAGFAEQEINGVSSTASFMTGVAERADWGLAENQAVRFQQLFELRQSVEVEAVSDNLVAVYGFAGDPETAQLVAQALIDEYVELQVRTAVAESEAAIEFFDEAIAVSRAELEAARDDVDQFLRSADDPDELSAAEQVEFDRLTAEEVSATVAVQAATDSREVARLARERATTDVEQRYSFVDPPSLPASRDVIAVDTTLLVVAFLIIGLVLSLIGPIASALRVRTVLFPDDLDLPVLAVVPRVPSRLLRPGDANPDAEPGDAAIGAPAVAAVAGSNAAEDPGGSAP